MIIINIKNEEDEEEAFGQKSIKILRIIRHIIFDFLLFSISLLVIVVVVLIAISSASHDPVTNRFYHLIFGSI